MKRSKPRVIQLGFNKTGTTSLEKLFRSNGYKTAGYKHCASQIQNNIQNKNHPFESMDDVDLFQDMENHQKGIYIYNHFELIYSHCPQDYYVLTTRSCESWLRSRLLHNQGKYAKIALKHKSLDSLEELVHQWRAEFYDYHSKVINFFKGNQNFYILPLEVYNFNAFKSFLARDFTFKSSSYPHVKTGRNETPARNQFPTATEYAKANYK